MNKIIINTEFFWNAINEVDRLMKGNIILNRLSEKYVDISIINYNLQLLLVNNI